MPIGARAAAMPMQQSPPMRGWLLDESGKAVAQLLFWQVHVLLCVGTTAIGRRTAAAGRASYLVHGPP